MAKLQRAVFRLLLPSNRLHVLEGVLKFLISLSLFDRGVFLFLLPFFFFFFFCAGMYHSSSNNLYQTRRLQDRLSSGAGELAYKHNGKHLFGENRKGQEAK